MQMIFGHCQGFRLYAEENIAKTEISANISLLLSINNDSSRQKGYTKSDKKREGQSLLTIHATHLYGPSTQKQMRIRTWRNISGLFSRVENMRCTILPGGVNILEGSRLIYSSRVSGVHDSIVSPGKFERLPLTDVMYRDPTFRNLSLRIDI
jgi:hypothetical protein